MHAQRLSRFVALGPPTKAAFRQTLGRQPESLPVVDQHLDRGCPPAAEHKQATRERIGIELGAAQLGQRVDALAEVDGLYRHQNPHLRRDLQHAYVVANARISSASSLVPMAFNSSRSFAPRGDSTSTRQLVAAPEPDAISSTNAGMALALRFGGGLRGLGCRCGWRRSAHFP